MRFRQLPSGWRTWFQAVLLLAAARSLPAAAVDPIPQRFIQELTRRFPGGGGLPAGPVALIEMGSDGAPRCLAQGQWYRLVGDRWTPLPSVPACGPGEFRYLDDAGAVVRLEIPWTDVRQLLRDGPRQFVGTAREILTVLGGEFERLLWPPKWMVHQLALGPGRTLWVGSSAGLRELTPDGWRAVEVRDGLGRAWAVADVLGVQFDTRDQLWFATRAGVGVRTADGWRFFEGRDGLPWNDFTGMTAGPDGAVWFGTHLGAIRFDGSEFHYRQGPRWLPDDDVRQIAVSPRGDAWFATAGGVGGILREPMTLAAKAAYYEEEIARYIRRTPFGFVAEASLRTPGDRSSADPQDSDNDGLWTAMYGAGECFGFGALRDPALKERARAAFEALRFLQQVTQGGSPAPPAGFVARTIRPVTWPDPNEGRRARDEAEQQGDALWKVYEPRWPRSADGQWFWKSDTSSDELDGHYFFYPAYFDLCADTEAERERVREVVRSLTDHLIQHGFTLTDHDGRPTRWGVYAPQSLNTDPAWWAERGLNSLSLLSYLAVAEHVTGDPKYGAISRDLVEQHGYGQNLMFPKVQFGPGSGNHSDDEMAVMCFYNLLKYAKDPALKNLARYSFFAYWANEAPELNPFFNFAFAPFGLGQSVTNIWGTFPVTPWDGWLRESQATLEDFPLDRINWPHRNSHRLDVVALPRQKARDLYDPDSRPRGGRVNGRVLPVSNRYFTHWNTDPWQLDYGGDGSELGAGTVFLLPYYLGLFEGYIQKP
ncbi:MAG: hypothetical protein KF791_18340 [Verrucomicrobiae bacterium]|nr:hypothetical protein [Verrucomicrobiae bacterium]